MLPRYASRSAITSRSAAIDGRMTCARLIWSRYLRARPAGDGAQMCGPIGSGVLEAYA
jgi:hypothetical protein